jgi:hypothetical protein
MHRLPDESVIKVKAFNNGTTDVVANGAPYGE